MDAGHDFPTTGLAVHCAGCHSFLEVGGSFGGPGGGLAEQLRLAEFDDTRPGGCFLIGCSGPTTHPTQEAPGERGA